MRALATLGRYFFGCSATMSTSQRVLAILGILPPRCSASGFSCDYLSSSLRQASYFRRNLARIPGRLSRQWPRDERPCLQWAYLPIGLVPLSSLWGRYPQNIIALCGGWAEDSTSLRRYSSFPERCPRDLASHAIDAIVKHGSRSVGDHCRQGGSGV